MPIEEAPCQQNCYPIHSNSAADMPGGAYPRASHTFTKRLSGVRLTDSTLTMDKALRNWVKIGLLLAQASQRPSQCPPADYLGLKECERLQTGSKADCVMVDRSRSLRAVT